MFLIKFDGQQVTQRDWISQKNTILILVDNFGIACSPLEENFNYFLLFTLKFKVLLNTFVQT